MTRLIISSTDPDRAVLDRAAQAIRAGRIVALPTDTLYGLAVDPFSDDAVERVFAVKGRPGRQPLPLVAFDLSQATQVGVMSPLAIALARRFWPGPLTLVVTALPRVSTAVTAGTGRVGVRVPAHQVARGLCETCGHPVTATSANRSGEPAPVDPAEVAASLAEVDILLDAGPAPGGPPSTVVDVSQEVPQLIRPGAVSWEEVRAWVGVG
jgi:L-threonylcarbamoyladenylate synthase